MDRKSHTVKVKDREVYLTGREFELLGLFLSDPHRIMTKEYIMEKLWKYDYDCEDAIIYTHIKISGKIRRRCDQKYTRGGI